MKYEGEDYHFGLGERRKVMWGVCVVGRVGKDPLH